MNKSNAGDEFFVEAYQHLFPNFNFIFTDYITKDKLNKADAVFIGGGSFLFAEPNIECGAILPLYNKKIFYIGVGCETAISTTHQKLLKKAVFIGCRSPSAIEKLREINKKAKFMPDLVYSLSKLVSPSTKIHKSVLIIPNITVVPTVNDPYWKHAAWSYFKSEFCQFLDWLHASQYNIKFMSMCNSNDTNDSWATAEIISHMKFRDAKMSKIPVMDKFSDIADFCSKFETIITQRFHGIVLSEMVKAPYMSIHHHDKLLDTYPNNGAFVSYYNLSKQTLINNFLQLNVINAGNIGIDPNIYIDFVKEINDLI